MRFDLIGHNDDLPEDLLSGMVIDLDQNGSGTITGRRAHDSSAVLGEISFDVRDTISGWFGRADTENHTFSSWTGRSWVKHPMGVALDDNGRALHTIPHPFTRRLRMCSNSVDLAMIMGALVNGGFENRGIRCLKRLSDCLTCHRRIIRGRYYCIQCSESECLVQVSIPCRGLLRK
jgi:hypothetical protein